MDGKWPLQDAKNRFSEMVNDAISHGPQWVTRHGEDAVVVVSAKQYRKLVKPKKDLLTFLQESPLKGVRLDFHRRKDYPRKIDL